MKQIEYFDLLESFALRISGICLFNVFARADENPFSVISLIKLIYASEKATIPDQRRDLESLRTIIMYKMASNY